MLSRRNFIKSVGVASVTLGAGFSLGKFIGSKPETNYVSFCGFLPNDNQLIENVLRVWAKDLNPNMFAGVKVLGDKSLSSSITKGVEASINNGSNKANLIVRVNRINDFVNSDIFLASNKYIYNPNVNFSGSLKDVRNYIASKKADFYITTEVENSSLLAKLTDFNTVVIESEKGIVDEINLNRKRTEVKVSGECGVNQIVVGEGVAYVKDASCRNKLCQHTGMLNGNNRVIACAPNKLIYRLV